MPTSHERAWEERRDAPPLQHSKIDATNLFIVAPCYYNQ